MGEDMAIPLRGNDPTTDPMTPELSGESSENEVRSSADVPTYDTYPAEPPRDIDWEGRKDQWRTYETRNPRLNETAEKIGSTVGEMVNRAQEARRKFGSRRDDIRQSSAGKVEEFKQRAQEQWSNATEAAQHRLDDWKQTAQESADEARRAIVQKTREARIRTRAYVNENPHHVLLGIAGAAFAVGLTARIMRSRHD
jgi:ElaB/YqjD/DUF883 family membrane-anchored ribosome-binding protein